VRKHTPKRVPEFLSLRNHIIFVTIFSPIDFKKRLSRRDIDERFHLSIAQDNEKNSSKALIHLVSLSMGLHLCRIESLALLQVRLCSTTSKNSTLGDVLALIKY
jgi:hypothetical protein